MGKGFVKLDRGFFDNPLWKEDRIFSRSEAWLDLIASALIDDLKVHVNGQDIEVQRGEFPASRRYLEKRWNWGSTKVRNYMEYLRKNGMISIRQTSGQTILRLVKFNDYNTLRTSGQTTNKPPPTQSKELKERKEVFKKQVFKYNGTFEFEMLCDFFDYWSEHNEKGRKMKFEMQRTWNLDLRLKKWKKNQLNWQKTKGTEVKQPQKISASELLRQKHGISNTR